MAQSHGHSTMQIPKLEGSSNHKSWSILCKSTLKSSGVWKFVDDSAVAPVQHADERDYFFAERVEVYQAKIAQAHSVILFSCKPHIQLTLETFETAKDYWNKLASSYASKGLIYIHDVWLEFCGMYQAILDRCASIDIVIQPKIQVIKFVGILDSHFEHWSANKHDGMRRSVELPTLESLMYKICDESKRLKQ